VHVGAIIGSQTFECKYIAMIGVFGEAVWWRCKPR
jgi:hypothetical protein